MTQGSRHYVPELVGRLTEPGQGCQGAEGSPNKNTSYHRGPKSAGYKYQQSERWDHEVKGLSHSKWIDHVGWEGWDY